MQQENISLQNTFGTINLYQKTKTEKKGKIKVLSLDSINLSNRQFYNPCTEILQS